jgi:hypothetical protein
LLHKKVRELVLELVLELVQGQGQGHKLALVRELEQAQEQHSIRTPSKWSWHK